MQEFLEHVIKVLVDNQEEIEITPVEQDGGTHFEIKLHPDDVGKIIGRNGATIHALRSLIQVGGAKKGVRCTMDIVEDEPRQPRPKRSGPPRRRPRGNGRPSRRPRSPSRDSR